MDTDPKHLFQNMFHKGVLLPMEIYELSQLTKMKQKAGKAVIITQDKQKLSTGPLKCVPRSLRMGLLPPEDWTCSPLGIRGALIPFTFSGLIQLEPKQTTAESIANCPALCFFSSDMHDLIIILQVVINNTHNGK